MTSQLFLLFVADLAASDVEALLAELSALPATELEVIHADVECAAKKMSRVQSAIAEIFSPAQAAP